MIVKVRHTCKYNIRQKINSKKEAYINFLFRLEKAWLLRVKAHGRLSGRGGIWTIPNR